MPRSAIALGVVLLVACPVGFCQRGGQGALTIRRRGEMVFKAAESRPVDRAALRRALRDVGHVQATYRGEPLKKWADGARIVVGRIHLTSVVGLNRTGRGEAPDEWIEKLAAPVGNGRRLVVLRLAVAPTSETRARRDRILTRADAAIRAGLLALAKDYPQLSRTNWGALAEALDGKSPAGRVSIWAGHYHGGTGGLREPVPKNDGYNVLVLLRPLHWPVPRGEWAMRQMYSHLALMGQVHVDAGDPRLRAALKKLIADALAPLERLDDAAAKGKATTRPATIPAVTSKAAERVRKLKGSVDSFRLNAQYRGPQDKPYYGLTLTAGAERAARFPAFLLQIHIDRAQADKIIDHLAIEGFLDEANSVSGERTKTPPGPCYVLWVDAGKVHLFATLGWDLKMLHRLDALRRVLKGDAAKAMDTLLDRLEGHRKAWTRRWG